uniref:RGS domain-containing protein n=1 Tax=Strigamia maritima TaxID=126957 RepID=T1JLG6_STRMM
MELATGQRITPEMDRAESKNDCFVAKKCAQQYKNPNAHVYQLMKTDSYSRYLRSEMYKEYLSGSKKKFSEHLKKNLFEHAFSLVNNGTHIFGLRSMRLDDTITTFVPISMLNCFSKTRVFIPPIAHVNGFVLPFLLGCIVPLFTLVR